MSIDATTNSQYIALKQSYDKQIDTDEQMKKWAGDMKDLQKQMQSCDPNSEDGKKLKAMFDKLTASMNELDPDGSIRKAISDGKDPAADLKKEEAEALSSLVTVLNGQEAIEQAEAAGKKASGLGEEPDLMTKVMMTFAMLGKANDTVTEGYMDQISTNVDIVTQLSTYSQTVRSARPDGTDSNAKGKVSADVIDKLKGLGVAIPGGATKNTDGTYSLNQSDFDTLINNIQSQSSSLTTLNQNKTIDLNKAIDIGQQCTTFQSSDLEKWAQLMNKLAN